jgi:hypothetical protein
MEKFTGQPLSVAAAAVDKQESGHLDAPLPFVELRRTKSCGQFSTE